MFATLGSEYGLSEGVDQLVADYRAAYPRQVERDASVLAGLSALRDAGWKVVVVTNGPATQLAKVEAAGLGGHVDAVCVSELVGVRKPDRRIFELAATMAGRHRADWMVGDHPVADIAGASAAGLRTIWLHRGRRWAHPALHPTRVVGSVTEAIDVLLTRPTPAGRLAGVRGWRSTQHVTAGIDHDRLSGDGAALVAGEEQSSVGDVSRAGDVPSAVPASSSARRVS